MELIGKLGEVAKALTFIFGAAALAVLLFAPALFGTRLHGTLTALEEAGLQVRFAAAGLTAELERLQEVTADVDAEVLELRARLAEAEAALAEARARSPLDGGRDAAEGDQILAENGGDADASDPVEAPIVIVEALPAWVVIAGAERDRDSQMAEVRKLRSAGFDAELFLAQGWYQAGVVFEGRAQASDAVDDVARVVGVKRAPYTRALDVFCPEADFSDPDLVVCGG